MRLVTPAYAESWDEDRQGIARADEMAKQGRTLSEAENEYSGALQEAQRVGAVGYAHSQTSHFRISASEIGREKKRYCPSEGEDVLPVPEAKKARIQGWAATATGDDVVAWLPDLRNDQKMNRNAMLEAGLGECIEETGRGRAQKRLNREREFRE